MRVCSEPADDICELVELAIDIEDQLEGIRDASDRIIQVLRGITEAETDEDETHDEGDELTKIGNSPSLPHGTSFSFVVRGSASS